MTAVIHVVAMGSASRPCRKRVGTPKKTLCKWGEIILLDRRVRGEGILFKTLLFLAGSVKRGWNAKYHIVTTIWCTYHTVNHQTLHLPHGAPTTRCTYQIVHLPHNGPTQAPYLPHSEPSHTAPTTQCTYHIVHLPHNALTQASHLSLAAPTIQCTCNYNA